MRGHLFTMTRRALAIGLLMTCGLAQALSVEFQRIADGVFVHVGDTGARTAANEGLNANIGLVLTPGRRGADRQRRHLPERAADRAGCAQGHAAAHPWVVNTGGQDHRWLGNGYFQAQGAETIAHAGGEADMRNRGNDQLQALWPLLGAKADGTVPTLPTRWLKAPDERLEFGGVIFEFRHRGGAHTPGDTMVWLPQKACCSPATWSTSTACWA
jgi:hypothetical protein